jgi:hypothetical protein
LGRNENNLGYSWKQLLTVDWTALSWNENNLPYSMDVIKKMIGCVCVLPCILCISTNE